VIYYHYLFNPFSPYSRIGAWRHGRRDGKKGIPPEEQTDAFPDYEMDLKQLADGSMRHVAGRWHDFDRTVCGRLWTAHRDRRRLDKQLKEAEGQVRAQQGKYDNCRPRFNELRGQLHIAPWLYLPLMSLIALGELPLNSIVFNLFGEDKILTYALAAVLGLVLTFCAHLLGKQLHEKPFEHGLGSTGAWMTILMMIVPVGVIAGIAFWREKYFEQVNAQNLMGMKVDPTMVTLVFVTINLLIYLVATVAAYSASNAEYRQVARELADIRKALGKSQWRMRKLAKQALRAESLYDRLRSDRQSTFDRYNREAEEVKDFAQRMIQAYRTHNMRHRPSPRRPPVFSNYPEITLPEVFRKELNWEPPQIIEAELRQTGAVEGLAAQEPPKNAAAPQSASNVPTAQDAAGTTAAGQS